jgi:transcriptional regulator with XRE-family HTH domain
MSRVRAGQPKRLAGKLKALRLKLGFTQEAMFAALKQSMPTDSVIHIGYLARDEAGTRVPSLSVLLAYSRIGKIPLEVLIDDTFTEDF